MTTIKKLTLLFAFAISGSTLVNAQVDNSYAFCNLFYLSTDQHAILPVDSLCFLNDNYDIINYRRMRVIGPIMDQKDLFKDYQFAFTFYMPEVTGDTRLVIEAPKDILSPEHNIPAGKFFFTISDNRERKLYGPGSDEVDFATVSGKVKIVEYRPASADVNHPEFNAQFDVYLRQVDRSGAQPVMKGPMIRLKGVLEVEKKREN